MNKCLIICFFIVFLLVGCEDKKINTIEQPKSTSSRNESIEISDKDTTPFIESFQMANEEAGGKEQYVGDETVSDNDSNNIEIDLAMKSYNHKKGDTITFGRYEQDGDTENGKESIEWEILDNDQEGVLLISKYILDAIPYEEDVDFYSSSYVSTWEKSYIRKWLNDDFLNSAFTADEQEKIILSYIKNDTNAFYGYSSGNDTEDKVFLLSVEDISQYYSFNYYSEEEFDYYGYSEELLAEGTQYAEDNNLGSRKMEQEYTLGWRGLNEFLKKMGHSHIRSLA